MRVALLPELVPDAENLLKRCLTQDIELYLSNAQGKKMWTMLIQSIFQSWKSPGTPEVPQRQEHVCGKFAVSPVERYPGLIRSPKNN